MKTKVLFVCSLHGGRARIAEAFARLDAGDLIEAEAACFEPGDLGKGIPFEVMREIGVELPQGATDSVFERYRRGERYDYVVSLCVGARTSACPLFERNLDTLYAREAARIAWNVDDFRQLPGTEEERFEGARALRDEIRALVRDLALRIQRERARKISSAEESAGRG